ncbi:TIGR01244 family sulfur transferase [Silicimonas sp. MF1-12-2]|jgi:uncharacterized protein (TIGR01244 family)|uniref:TIGR01244 family sulfur transferase n=1 Tax=Silicimonas sp. MF1-12-2 TaxID=3384793 RepID=UPI0039B3C1A1
MTVARYLTETFAVAPQIAIEDLADLKAQGFKTIVCNRPDGEVPEELSAANMERACRELGLEFVMNPLSHGSLSPDHIEIQRRAATSDGPVLAYCASGNRSSILWGLAMAGTHTTEDILNRTTAAGYNLQALVPQLDAIAARSAG